MVEPAESRPRRFRDLERDERRRAVTLSIARIVVGATALVAVYYAIAFDWNPVAQIGGTLLLAGVFFCGVFVWQLRSVVAADLPEMRALEALAFSSVLLIVLFAGFYLSLSNDDPNTFSESLNHTGALYFTMTTVTTVGYGDIAARTDAARIGVMVQMVATFVVLGVLIKLLVAVARKRVEEPTHAD